MEMRPTPADNLADDLLRGAEKIADFLFGDATKRRKIYHLAETSQLPIFRLGSKLCARRSVLLKWIAEQEQRCWQAPPGDKWGSTIRPPKS